MILIEKIAAYLESILVKQQIDIVTRCTVHSMGESLMSVGSLNSLDDMMLF